MKQKIITTTLLITLAFMSCINLRAESILIGSLKYKLNGSTAEVDVSSDAKGNVTIPDQVTYNGTNYDVTSIADWAFSENTGITSITFGKKLTNIGMNAFSGCTNITTLIFPNNITTIGVSAFTRCYELTSVTLSSNLKEIDWYTFQYCEKLIQVLIPEGVESIGEEAFVGCLALESINIPKSVTSIDWNAFDGCTALKTINVASENPAYTSVDGILYNKAQTEIKIVPQGIIGNVTIPATTSTIPAGIFRDRWSIEGITILGNVETIYMNTFRDCEKLKSVTLPNSVKTINDWAFKGCKELISINLPANLTDLGYNVFTSCEKLPSITIPNKITVIKESTFELCYGLTEVDFGTGVTTIENKVFSNCLALDTLIIPNNVISIGESSFSDCKALNSITLGNKVASLGKGAFSNCTNIKEIVVLNPVPPTCGASLFYLIIPNNAKLYVPNGSMNAYKGAETWKSFKKMFELYEDGKKPMTISVSKEGNGSIHINETDVPASTIVKEGTDVNLSFKPDNGYVVSKVTLNNEEITDKLVENKYTVKSIKENLTIKVEFKQAHLVTLVYTKELGSVTVNGQSVSSLLVEAGKPVLFAVTPKESFIHKSSLNGQEVQLTNSNTYEINTLDKAVTFEVEFRKEISVTTEYDSNMGVVKINDEEVSSARIKEGTQVKFTITPKDGYKFETVTSNSTDVTEKVVDGIYTQNATVNIVLKVNFIKLNSIQTTNKNEMKVYTSQGKVFIENVQSDSVVLIVNSKGQTVYQGTQREIELENGFYILKIGGKTSKVVIE